MDDPRRILTPAETADELAGTAFVHAGAQLDGAYRTADFAASVRLLDAIAIASEAAGHHPEVQLGWGRLAVELSSHDVSGVTVRDIALAQRIDELAREQGARPGN